MPTVLQFSRSGLVISEQKSSRQPCNNAYLATQSKHPFLLCSVQILGGSVDGSVRQFDIRMGMMFTDTLHESVTGIAVSHDGNCVLASCLDNSMKLLDKASGELLATYIGESFLWPCILRIPQVQCSSSSPFLQQLEQSLILPYCFHHLHKCHHMI